MELALINYSRSDHEGAWLARLMPSINLHIYRDPEQKLVLRNSIVMCSRLNTLRSDLLVRIASTPGVILFHISDEWYREDYSVYQHFTHVIRSFCHSGMACESVTTIPLGPVFSRIKAGPVRSIAERQYVWCFAGQQVTTRRAMVQHLRNLEPNYTYMAGSKDFSGPRLSGQEYLSLIEDTVFVPCPMGNVHLESFRLYEALDCGCIPIVERRPWLDYFTLLFGEHPLPTVSHWRDAPRLISELNQEGPACLQLKQDEIQDWWRSYREKLSSILENVLQENRDRTSRVQLRWPADTRWRGFIELLQHHNKTALAARAKLTFRRLRRRLVPNAFRHRSQES